ncbi:MAG: hypothetical protein K6G43_00295 [Lachnospiraceae bacterium]|nr:hypothetical protein [Lachnospiraceae bacterium]
MRKKLFKSIIALMAALTMVIGIPVVSHAAPQTMPDGAIFDPEYYAAHNPDVVAVMGDSAANLYAHYVFFGKNEGRLPYEGQTAPVNVLNPTDVYNSLLASGGYVWVYYDPSINYYEAYSFDLSGGFADITHAGSLVDLSTIGNFCVVTGNILPPAIDYKVGAIDPNAVYLFMINRATVSSIGATRNTKSSAYKIIGFDGTNLVLEIQTGYGVENRVFTRMSL